MRESQKAERASLTKDIDDANSKIQSLILSKNKYTLEERKAQVDFGPLTYIAQLIYGTSSDALLEKAVRYIIITLIFVFDPLALLLLLAANIGFNVKFREDPYNRDNEGKINLHPSEIAHL